VRSSNNGNYRERKKLIEYRWVNANLLKTEADFTYGYLCDPRG
jgi:hypothetical protein